MSKSNMRYSVLAGVLLIVVGRASGVHAGDAKAILSGGSSPVVAAGAPSGLLRIMQEGKGERARLMALSLLVTATCKQSVSDDKFQKIVERGAAALSEYEGQITRLLENGVVDESVLIEGAAMVVRRTLGASDKNIEKDVWPFERIQRGIAAGTKINKALLFEVLEVLERRLRQGCKKDWGTIGRLLEKSRLRSPDLGYLGEVLFAVNSFQDKAPVRDNRRPNIPWSEVHDRVENLLSKISAESQVVVRESMRSIHAIGVQGAANAPVLANYDTRLSNLRKEIYSVTAQYQREWPDYSRLVQRVAETRVSSAELMNGIAGLVGKNNKDAGKSISAVTALVTGNYLAAASQVAGMLGISGIPGFGDGGGGDQVQAQLDQISEQLNGIASELKEVHAELRELSKEVREFRTEVREQFDGVNRRLDSLRVDMLLEFEGINRRLDQSRMVQGSLLEVAEDASARLIKLQHQFLEATNSTLLGLRQLEVYLAAENAAECEWPSNSQMPESTFVRCAAILSGRAVERELVSVIVGANASASLAMQLGAFKNASVLPLDNLPFLISHAQARGVIKWTGERTIIGQTRASEWVQAASAYAKLLKRWPKYARKLHDNQVAGVIARGKWIANAQKMMSDENTAANLVAALADEYLGGLVKLQNYLVVNYDLLYSPDVRVARNGSAVPLTACLSSGDSQRWFEDNLKGRIYFSDQSSFLPREVRLAAQMGLAVVSSCVVSVRPEYGDMNIKISLTAIDGRKVDIGDVRWVWRGALDGRVFDLKSSVALKWDVYPDHWSKWMGEKKRFAFEINKSGRAKEVAARVGIDEMRPIYTDPEFGDVKRVELGVGNLYLISMGAEFGEYRRLLSVGIRKKIVEVMRRDVVLEQVIAEMEVVSLLMKSYVRMAIDGTAQQTTMEMMLIDPFLRLYGRADLMPDLGEGEVFNVEELALRAIGNLRKFVGQVDLFRRREFEIGIERKEGPVLGVLRELVQLVPVAN